MSLRARVCKDKPDLDGLALSCFGERYAVMVKLCNIIATDTNFLFHKNNLRIMQGSTFIKIYQLL